MGTLRESAICVTQRKVCLAILILRVTRRSHLMIGACFCSMNTNFVENSNAYGFIVLIFISICYFFSAEEEFDELCFEFGLELDEVVRKFYN